MCMILDGKIENEPSLRLAIEDPVAKMLCNIQGFFYALRNVLSPPILAHPQCVKGAVFKVETALLRRVHWITFATLYTSKTANSS